MPNLKNNKKSLHKFNEDRKRKIKKNLINKFRIKKNYQKLINSNDVIKTKSPAIITSQNEFDVKRNSEKSVSKRFVNKKNIIDQKTFFNLADKIELNKKKQEILEKKIQKKKQKFNELEKRTLKGQPYMNPRINNLLEKIIKKQNLSNDCTN